MQMIPYLYRWIHLPTQKWYIGSKTGKDANPQLHEKYICSSKIVKPMIIEDRNNWIFEILCIGEAAYIRQLETSLLKLFIKVILSNK